MTTQEARERQAARKRTQAEHHLGKMKIQCKVPQSTFAGTQASTDDLNRARKARRKVRKSQRKNGADCGGCCG